MGKLTFAEVTFLIWALAFCEGGTQVAFTECFEERDTLFIYVIEPVSFASAINDCEARGATLARISDEEEFNFAREFMDNTNFTDGSVWIGMPSF